MKRLPIIGKAVDVDLSAFTQTPPQLHVDGEEAPVPVEAEQLLPYAGIFVVRRPEDAARVPSGGHGHVEFSGLGNTLLVRVTVVETEPLTGDGGAGDGVRLKLWFLRLLRHSAPPARLDPGEEIRCPPDFQPILWGDHPWFFRRRLRFKIRGFIEGGMVLGYLHDVTAVVKGLEFEAVIALPSLGVFTERLRVTEVEHDEARPTNYCTVAYVDPSRDFLEGVARYLLANVPTAEREAVVRLGYPFPALEHASRFEFVSDESGLRRALSLRLEAYRSREGAKLDELTEPEQMRDAFDDHAIHFLIEVGPKAVASGRLVVNDGHAERSEIGSLVPLPDWLWRAGFVECSRFATDAGYRGRDVFANLTLQASRVAYQLGFRYILADCEEHLLPVYRRRGAQSLGVTFTHPLEGVTLHVVYYDIHRMQKLGRFLAPAKWAKTWGSVLKYYDD